MIWKKVRLLDLLKQIKQIVQIDKSKKYKLVTVSNKGIIKQREIVKGVEIKGEKAFEAKNGAFIYSRLSVHNGAFGIIPLELEGALLTAEMPIFEIGERILPEFLIYSLQLPTFKFQLEQLSKGVGRTRVKEVDFLSLLIELPNITQQKEIVEKLTKVKSQCDEIFSELTHQMAIVKKLRHQLLKDALLGKLVVQNPEEEPVRELLMTIKAEKEKLRKGNVIEPISEASIAIKIPSNWIWCKFGEVIQMKRGKFSVRPRNDPSYFGGEYPFIQIGSLDERGSVIIEAKQTLNEKGIKVSRKFPINTIAIAIVGGTIGNLGVLGREMYFTDSIIGILPNQYYNQDFILYYLRYKQPEIKSEAYQMAGQPNIKIPTLENLLYPMPPLSEQNRIVQKLDEVMQYCNEKEANIKQSEFLNRKILQQIVIESFMKD